MHLKIFIESWAAQWAQLVGQDEAAKAQVVAY